MGVECKILCYVDMHASMGVLLICLPARTMSVHAVCCFSSVLIVVQTIVKLFYAIHAYINA